MCVCVYVLYFVGIHPLWDIEINQTLVRGMKRYKNVMHILVFNFDVSCVFETPVKFVWCISRRFAIDNKYLLSIIYQPMSGYLARSYFQW